MCTRRFLLKSTGLALASTSGVPAFLCRAVGQSRRRRQKTLVAIFQRGAMDGLSVVAPYGEARYHRSRPSIAYHRPGSGERALLDLDGHFGLHPALAPLKPLWDQKVFGIIHATGSPDATRSHFDAQDYMETATPGRKGTRQGWLDRFQESRGTEARPPLRAVSFGPQAPMSLRERSAVAMRSLREFELARDLPFVHEAFRNMYAGEPADRLGERIQTTSRETFKAMETVREIRAAAYRPANSASYPRGPMGRALEDAARLIKADVGLEVAFVDSDGWDTHASQKPRLDYLLTDFGKSLAAFATDLDRRMDDVLVLTMSEFGRTVRENGSRGTDHGHANLNFVIGGATKGGKVHGEWPGLADEALFEGRDLAVTTDFRDVFAEVLARHFGMADVNAIFPGYLIRPSRFRGFLRA